MKRQLIATILPFLFLAAVHAQPDALVVEQHNGLADIFVVNTDIHIDNRLEKDSIFILDKDSIMAGYARADVRRIAFDTEPALTDSVERAALVAFYKATDGDNWIWNDNWCTDLPLNYWGGIGTRTYYYSDDQNEYRTNVDNIWLNSMNLNGTLPIELFNLKKLRKIALDSNYENLKGDLPKEIGRLTELTEIDLRRSAFSGPIPKELGNLRNLRKIQFFGDCFCGEIPPELGNLTELEILDLGANFDITGTIPPELGKLTKLWSLVLDRNQLTGEIPAELGNLTNLTELNLSNNQLTGEIPESFSNLKNLFVNRDFQGITPGINLQTHRNCLSGKIPSLFIEHPSWKHEWWNLLAYNSGYNLEELNIPAPSFHVTDVNGNILDSEEIYPNNKFTAIFHWATWCVHSNALINEIKPLYEMYKESGFDIVGFAVSMEEESEQVIRDYISENQLEWQNFISSPDNMLDYYSSCVSKAYGYPGGGSPEFTIIDSLGNVVFSDCVNNRSDIESFLKSRLGEGKVFTNYESTDYSADGTVKTLQDSNYDRDVKVIIMGDGFSDRQIKDGSYDKAMQRAMDALFTDVIANRYQDRFTVKSVTAVSKNEIFSDSTETALGGFYNKSVGLGCNAAKVFDYAKKAISAEDMDDAIIVVLLNSELSVSSNEAGVCYMYDPATPGKYASGASISVIPDFSGNGGIYDYTSFENVLRHEVLGHGFAKLADEYVEYQDMIPADIVKQYQIQDSLYGWYRNIDFTTDAEKVKWGGFISDSRSQDEWIRVYEGAATYGKGVYRPSYFSLMGMSSAEFNAPSREAIWYRINKLTQDETWEGSYEDFVKFDKSLKTVSSQAMSPLRTPDIRSNQPVYRDAPLVVKHINWREEK